MENGLLFAAQALINLILICGTNANNAVLLVASDRLKDYHFLHCFLLF